MYQNNNIKEELTRDPLHNVQCKMADLTSYPEGHSKMSYVNSGRICLELAGYYTFPKYMNKALLYGLQEVNKTAILIMHYLIGDIMGGTNGSQDRPKTHKRVSIRRKDLDLDLLNKLCLTSASNFYNALDGLFEKELIFISDRRLFINFWPLTWNIEKEIFREKIREIVESEVERSKKKIKKEHGDNSV